MVSNEDHVQKSMFSINSQKILNPMLDEVSHE